MRVALFILIAVHCLGQSIAGCIFGNEDDPIYTHAYDWVRSVDAEKEEMGQFVVPYKKLKKAVPEEVESDAVSGSVSKALEKIRKVLPAKAKGGPENSAHMAVFRIQETAGLCGLLGEDIVVDESIAIRLLARKRLTDIRAQNGTSNFVFEVSVKKEKRLLAGYFYYEELFNFLDGGDWRDRKLVFLSMDSPPDSSRNLEQEDSK